MLQKIVFQDNIYQLARSIDTVQEGLILDLSDDYFFDKTVDDLLFFDATIQRIVRQLQANSRLPDYPALLAAIHSCQNAFLRTIASVLEGKSAMTERFVPLFDKLKEMSRTHTALRADVARALQHSDRTEDARDVVSGNELSELLHF